jgi:hypothetical protein
MDAGAEGRISRDRAMILCPLDWPRWPLLPLTRRDGALREADSHAFMFANNPPGRPVVYFGLIHGREMNAAARRILAATQIRPTWRQVLDGMRKWEFESLDALLAHYEVSTDLLTEQAQRTPVPPGTEESRNTRL